MADRTTWKRRVAEWRASGLTSRRFADGRSFAPVTLTWWAWNLGRESARDAGGGDLGAGPRAVNRVRFARVVPRALEPTPAPVLEAENESPVVVRH